MLGIASTDTRWHRSRPSSARFARCGGNVQRAPGTLIGAACVLMRATHQRPALSGRERVFDRAAPSSPALLPREARGRRGPEGFKIILGEWSQKDSVSTIGAPIAGTSPHFRAPYPVLSAERLPDLVSLSGRRA